ncbi:MAG: transporter substrate-binding domain-containing protein [Hahellaceae bacterium]|nr:transporter substrate-binding domain-containing protein [Hahellaceae bacterium]
MQIKSFAQFCKCVQLVVTGLLITKYANGETIRLSNGEWPPYLSEKLKYNGFVSHIVSAAFATQGIEVEYVFRPWKRAYEEARIGALDGSVVWSLTDERAKDFLFSDTVIEGKSVFFYRKNKEFNWKNDNDLKKFRIGGTLGYSYKFETHGVKISESVAEDSINFMKLYYNRIDIFPSDKDAGIALLNTSLGQAYKNAITWHPLPYDSTKYCLILNKINKQNVQHLERFNRGLKLITNNGQMADILANQEKGNYVTSD